MARTLLCEIVTPEKVLYTNEVEMVVAPTLEGEIGILPLHVPLVTVLKPGELRVRYNDNRDVDWFAISGGYLQVHEDKVIVLADNAVQSSQIDVDRAREGMTRLEERMSQLKNDAAGEGILEDCERDLKWCKAQLEVAAKQR
jgi:F-type H+-transporting ATPase subunit epsilon